MHYYITLRGRMWHIRKIADDSTVGFRQHYSDAVRFISELEVSREK